MPLSQEELAEIDRLFPEQARRRENIDRLLDLMHRRRRLTRDPQGPLDSVKSAVVGGEGWGRWSLTFYIHGRTTDPLDSHRTRACLTTGPRGVTGPF